MGNDKRNVSRFNLSLFIVFGIAAAIMAPISVKRGEMGMAVFWFVQLAAMLIGFIRNYRR